MACCSVCDLEREWGRVAHSPLLLRSGGVAVLEGLFDAAVTRGLCHEALHRPRREDEHPPGADPEQVRGGTPARRLISVEGGPLQESLFGHPQVATLLAQQVGGPVRPCGLRASYSIYNREGAHLDVHRDVGGCDLALIACLYDSEPGAEGGATDVWFDDALTPLGTLREGGGGAPTRVALQPGQTMLLHGGVLPHRIRPLQAGRLRVVSLMCFEILGAPAVRFREARTVSSLAARSVGFPKGSGRPRRTREKGPTSNNVSP